MSTKILDRVWKAAPDGITAYQRLLLVRIAWYADDAGRNCYASVASLARETRATERGVRNAMRQLENRRMISVETGKGPRGTNRVALDMSVLEWHLLRDGDAGLNRDAGATLHCGSLPPEPPCNQPLNGGSANKQERHKRNRIQTDSVTSDRSPDGGATAEELYGSGLMPEDFASYMLVRKKKGCSFVDIVVRNRWLSRFRGFYAEGKDTTDMLHRMIEGGWKEPVEEKWKQRPVTFRPATDEDDIWSDLPGVVQ